MATPLPSFDKECFVISPIGQAGSAERKRADGILEYIISPAAYELNLDAVRGDQLAEPGQITRQVLDHVIGAKAAVADLTGLNPNVFYELAVRHAGPRPVALIAEEGCELPFDIAQMRTIFFDSKDLASAADCRKSITSHLRNALEKKGPVDSPIASSIDAQNLSKGSSADRSIVDILTAVENIANMQRRMAYDLIYLRGGMDSNLSSDHEVLTIISEVQARAAELTKSGDSAEYDHLMQGLAEISAKLSSIRSDPLGIQHQSAQYVGQGRPSMRPRGK